MNQRIKTIFEQAQALSAEDREQLAELLYATVDPPQDFDKAWADEAARRWEEHGRSGIGTFDALQAIDEVRAELKPSE